jgi:hypothetical protein
MRGLIAAALVVASAARDPSATEAQCPDTRTHVFQNAVYYRELPADRP